MRSPEMRKKSDLRRRLRIPRSHLQEINQVLEDPKCRIITDLLEVIGKYGTPEEINAKAREAGSLDRLMDGLSKVNPEYHAAIQWLIQKRDTGAFISVDEYRRSILGIDLRQSLFGNAMP
jgi:hypothetical protein